MIIVDEVGNTDQTSTNPPSNAISRKEVDDNESIETIVVPSSSSTSVATAYVPF